MMTDTQYKAWIDAEFAKIDRESLIGYAVTFMGIVIIALCILVK